MCFFLLIKISQDFEHLEIFENSVAKKNEKLRKENNIFVFYQNFSFLTSKLLMAVKITIEHSITN